MRNRQTKKQTDRDKSGQKKKEKNEKKLETKILKNKKIKIKRDGKTKRKKFQIDKSRNSKPSFVNRMSLKKQMIIIKMTNSLQD